MKVKRICVDFDNTLFHTSKNFPIVGKQRLVNKLVAWYIRRKKRQGNIIMLNTLREYGKGLEEAIEACNKHNIPIDYVNENLPDCIAFWGDSRKLGCDINIDDKNIGLIGAILRRWG